MSVTIRIAFWGDHRGFKQHKTHDHIEQARWRWRVARNIDRRQLAMTVDTSADVPRFLRRQAE